MWDLPETVNYDVLGGVITHLACALTGFLGTKRANDVREPVLYLFFPFSLFFFVFPRYVIAANLTMGCYVSSILLASLLP